MSVSLLHEGVIELVRDEPSFLARLLHEVRHPLPIFKSTNLVDPSINQLVPVEARADALLLFEDDGPGFGVVLESQLERDEEKRYTWPLYAVAARARHRRPILLVVITPSETTKRWASQPIDLGNEAVFRPLVIGPSDIPTITDLVVAQRDPPLAVLSAIAHGNDELDVAVSVAQAALAAIQSLHESRAALYSRVVIRALKEGAREKLKMLSNLIRLLPEEERRPIETAYAKGLEEGRANLAAELAAVVIQSLETRGFALAAPDRERVVSCQDPDVIKVWLFRAATITSIEQLFA